MQKQNNWSRQTENNPNQIQDYYSQFEEYDQDFKGDYFKCKIIECWSQEIIYTDKKTGKNIANEIVNVVFLDAKTNKYFISKVWGARTVIENGVRGLQGRNPNRLQDLLEIICSQNGDNCTDKQIEVSSKYGTRVYYPDVCGAIVFVLAVKKGENVGANGKTYDDNIFEFYTQDGRAWIEVEQNVPVEKKCVMRMKYDEFKKIYADYVNGGNSEEDVKKNEELVQKVVAVPVKPVPTAEPQTIADDDIPF